MNGQERITQLETMLTEERAKVSYVLGVFESYARGLDMIARMTYAETPVGSMDEKNATAMKQHTTDMLGWLEIKAEELRGMMGRAMPAVQEEAPEPPDNQGDLAASGLEDILADPSVPAESVEQVTVH